MITGLVSGAVGQFVSSPADLVKVQMQTEGLRKRQGLPPRYVIFICLPFLLYLLTVIGLGTRVHLMLSLIFIVTMDSAASGLAGYPIARGQLF